jgi:flagellum-specific peptidoglycan hydrolase FlgJ
MNKLTVTMCSIVCFMLAAPPFALAQDKAKDAAGKAAPAVEVKVDKVKSDEKKSDKAKRTEAQKANDARVKECNAQAGEKKGDERKKFMVSCMKSQKKADDDKNKAQRERQRSCDKIAKDKKVKSDDRKAFMQDCLSARK